MESPVGYWLSLLSGWLASCSGLLTPSARALLTSVIPQRPKNRYLGEIEPQAQDSDSVSQDAGKHHPRESISSGLSDHQILGYSFTVPRSWSFSIQALAKAFRPHGFHRMVCAARQNEAVSIPVAVKGPLVVCGGQTKYDSTPFWDLLDSLW